MPKSYNSLAVGPQPERRVQQRRRTVWRMDGGAGSDSQFWWLLDRGYHVIAKGLSSSRAASMANTVRRWDTYHDYQLAEVSPPVDYGRPVRVFVKRRWKNDAWQHSYYISALQSCLYFYL